MGYVVRIKNGKAIEREKYYTAKHKNNAHNNSGHSANQKADK
jgi:hypothetical protein